jgi:hypothetical protein
MKKSSYLKHKLIEINQEKIVLRISLKEGQIACVDLKLKGEVIIRRIKQVSSLQA